MPNMILLGFDYGCKRIGIASGQLLTKTASPLTQIATEDWSALDNIMRRWQPKIGVVGLPLNMDGTTSQLSAMATRFGKQLSARYDLAEVAYHDERLSSRAAIERLDLMGINKPSKSQINATAAAIILEGWMQSQPD